MRRFLTATLGALLLLPVMMRGADQLHHRPAYTLHTGDVIALGYRYTPEFDQTVTVQPDGTVSLNIVGSVKIAGLTVDEARQRILEKASVRLNNPELTITLQQFEQPYVVVAGEVEHPGKIGLRDTT